MLDHLTRRRARIRAARAARVAPPLLALLLMASACGPSSSNQDFTQCGNGRVDSGEACDDGNLDDHDSCTAVCRPARCGDSTAEAGVEQCDGLDLDTASCGTLGLAGLGLACTAACEFDTSQCGAAFTPTPTAAPTRFVTPTFTPEPIPCGDGLLQAGQTCEECPADCTPAACEPTTEQVRFVVTLEAATGAIERAALFVGYRSSVISIPGTGSEATVRRRVRPLPPLPTEFSVSDLDYGLRLTARQTSGLSMDFVTADFDTCAGAGESSVDDLSCSVESCEVAGQAVSDCTCAIEAGAQ
ncbi:MAG: hypothetical protein ACRDUX_00440 [Mycobacterium sp.]